MCIFPASFPKQHRGNPVHMYNKYISTSGGYFRGRKDGLMNLFPKNRNFDGKDLSNQVFEMDGLGNTWVCHPDIDEKGQDFDRCSFVGANLSGSTFRIYT